MAPFSKQPQTSLFFTPFSAALLAFSFFLSSSLVLVLASTDTSDVEALQVLYTSLNNPPQLTGWNANGRDPCGESWMGITCEESSVIAIQVSGLGLSGTMGYLLGNFNSLRILDLSNNNIHDSISYSLPASLTSLNLANNNLSGSLPYSITTLVSLTYLNLGHNSLSQLIGDVFANLHQLLALDLSFNNLSGDLPNSFGSLSSLTNLYLQNNQLTGSVGVLSDLPLTELNIAFNHFNGWIPQKFSSNPNFIYNGNSFDNGPDPPPPPFTPLSPGESYDNTNHPGPNTNINQGSDSQGDKGMTTGHIVGVVLSSIMVLVCAVFAFVFCFRKLASKGKYEARSSLGTLPLCPDKVIGSAMLDQRVINMHMATELKPPPAENLTSNRVQGKTGSSKRLIGPITATSYTVASLQAATKGFSQENLVGEGSLGRVYIAEYPDGKILAVKKIDSTALSLQEEDNFLEAVSNMSRLRHRNIVTLIGFCAEHGQRLLIYEYIRGGTLHDALHFIEDSSRTLTWNARVRVALGTARALEYLHEVCLPSVVHRNFKSANILLDEELNPHLSDCGLAALTPNTERQVSTQMVGSFGYSAPEFAMSGIYTVKSDVYSFGVVMLELLTGRKPLDSSRTRSEQSLVRWATPQLHDIDALAKMVDPTLNGMYSVKSLSRFADIIALCIQPEPEFRPPMSDVVQALVRLMQRASGVRRSRDESGIPYRFPDHEV